MQEAVGYFFCMEDRALLCRSCDVVVHTANSLVSTHQRFVLTGVKVGLEATKPGPSLLSGTTLSRSSTRSDPPPAPKRTTQITIIDKSNRSLPVQASVGADISSSKSPFIGGSTTESASLWQLDEFLDLGDYNENHDFMSHGSSKVRSVHTHIYAIWTGRG